MSTSRHYAWSAKGGWVFFALLAACGWRVGAPENLALQLAPVEGATTEPGLRSALDSAMILALRRRGIAVGGNPVRVRILQVTHVPETAVAKIGTAGWRTDLALSVRTDRCSFEVLGQRSWTVTTRAPQEAVGERGRALDVLATELADRAIDRLMGKKCR